MLQSCEREVESEPLGLSVTRSEHLAPEDLGIQKMTFRAHPSADEVAIFRSSFSSRTEPPHRQTYDQIYYDPENPVEVDLVIAPLSFYVGYPEPEPATRENAFWDSWKIRADKFSYDVIDYCFVGSTFSSLQERSVGEIVYSKNSVSHTKDLQINFEMFTLSLEEAVRLHPELKESREKGTVSWGAAFLVEEKGKGRLEEARTQGDAQEE